MDMLDAKQISEESSYTGQPRKRTTPKKKIIYPDSDGKPMADNTKQFDWIVKIKVNLDQMFADNPDVFVAGDLLWYPVEGSPKIRIAPDAMAVFGRPKGHRGSYKMWEEDGIAPQVVFEILSPGNTVKEMRNKLKFYETYGVWEYYVYDPDNIRLEGWICKNNILHSIGNMQGWVSPILKIRFELREDDLEIFRPDGKKFLYPTDAEREYLTKLDSERRKSEQAEKEAEAERQRANSERLRAESERLRAESEWLRAEKLAAKLRELGIEADAI